jgi:hypothetical protein
MPGSNQILAEIIKAGGLILQYEIRNLINSIWSKDQWKDSIIVPPLQEGR